MTRQKKIELLNSVATGKASIEDIQEDMQMDYSKFTNDELRWLIDVVNKYGGCESLWPVEEQEKISIIKAELPERNSYEYVFK